MNDKEQDEWNRVRDNYSKLRNPAWKNYRPALPAGDPEFDATLLDMLEKFAVEGEITIKRTFLPDRYAWQIGYKVSDAKGMMMGGGSSVRDALAAVAIGIAERALK